MEKSIVMENSNLEKTFIELVQNNERLIYKVCSMYITDEFPMADLYQEVVYNLWKSFPKFKKECSESTWMYRVALNTCITGMTLNNIAIKIKRIKEKLKQMSNN